MEIATTSAVLLPPGESLSGSDDVATFRPIADDVKGDDVVEMFMLISDVLLCLYYFYVVSFSRLFLSFLFFLIYCFALIVLQ